MVIIVPRYPSLTADEKTLMWLWPIDTVLPIQRRISLTGNPLAWIYTSIIQRNISLHILNNLSSWWILNLMLRKWCYFLVRMVFLYILKYQLNLKWAISDLLIYGYSTTAAILQCWWWYTVANIYWLFLYMVYLVWLLFTLNNYSSKSSVNLLNYFPGI